MGASLGARAPTRRHCGETVVEVPNGSWEDIHKPC